jgi:hypothetical protein
MNHAYHTADNHPIPGTRSDRYAALVLEDE